MSNCTDITIGGDDEPNLDASLAYDSAPRILTINHLHVSRAPNADAWADLHGSITLPKGMNNPSR